MDNFLLPIIDVDACFCCKDSIYIERLHQKEARIFAESLDLVYFTSYSLREVQQDVRMRATFLPTLPPRGMRDHGPTDVLQRRYIKKVLTDLFAKYGFLPIETSAMEQAEVLRNQYGEEGEKLIYFAVNSSELLKKSAEEKELLSVAKRAMRYDLTVPLARYVAAQGQRLTLPFRRYQIQPVWRADRPQQSRYREFCQCDADIIGSRSLLCELDMFLLIHEAFLALDLGDYQLRVNHRGLLSAIARAIDEVEKEQILCTLLDKLDKTEKSVVQHELIEKGFSKEATKKLWHILEIDGTTTEVLQQLEAKLGSEAEVALSEIRELLQLLGHLSSPLLKHLRIDLSLARGLSYYTGTIFEVTHPKGSSSLLGGGRYDNLTQRFSSQQLPGVGLSFGLERIHDLLLERGEAFDEAFARPHLLLAYLGKEASVLSLALMQKLRKQLRCEHYPSPDKLKKQFNYAEKKKIPYILFAGEEEHKEKRYGLKNIRNGEQRSLSVEEITKLLKDSNSTSTQS